MKNLIIFLLPVLITSVIIAQDPNKSFPAEIKDLKNPETENPSAYKYGYKIYKKICWTCHGDEGNGKGSEASTIQTKVAGFKDPIVLGRTDGQLFYWIQHGGNDMQPYNDLLSDQEIWQVVTYIRKIQDGE